MAVNGVAAGGGLSLALSGDLVVATESAKFTMAYSKIAATPDGSSSYFLPRLVGLRRAMELYFTNRVLTAREAVEWGLVTRVVPDAEFKAGGRRAGARAGAGTVEGVRRRQAAVPPVDVGEPRDPDGAGGAGHRRLRAAPRTSAPASPPSPRRRRPVVPRPLSRRRVSCTGGSHEAARLLPPGLIVLRQDEGAALVLGGRVRSRRHPGRSRRRDELKRLGVPARARRLGRRPGRARLEPGRLRRAAGRARTRASAQLPPAGAGSPPGPHPRVARRGWWRARRRASST